MTAKKVAAKVAKPAAKAAAKAAPSVKKAGAVKVASVEKKPAAKKAGSVSKAKKVSQDTGVGLVSPKGEVAFKQIEQAAYFLAEKDGFSKDPLAYWCAAEVKLGMRKA